MGWQPGRGGGTGAGPDRDPRVPGGVPPVRDPRLAWFAAEDGVDTLVPSGSLALAADEVSGLERRCPGATGDELTGLLRAWAAVESWAASAKLGVIAEMIRRDDQPRKDGGRHGVSRQRSDLPDDWSPSLRHDLALALACSVQSAQTTAWLAWELRARLPGIGALLDGGTLTLAKARAVAETFQFLTDADAAAAESLILGQLRGKTYPQVLRLAEQAALTVDPELATRRREQAQKSARVTFFREQSGTAGLSGRDLPPDEALAAMAAVNARAQVYEDCGAFGDIPMDQLRAYAYTDLLKGIPAEDRIACAGAQDTEDEIAEALAWANARAARNAAQARAGHGAGTKPGLSDTPDPGTGAGTGTSSGAGTRDDDADAQDGPPDCPCGRCDGDCLGDDDPDDPEGGGDSGPNLGGPGSGGPASGRDDDEPDDPVGGDGGPGPGGAGHGPGPGAQPSGRALQPRPADLVIPLLTLLGRAERPGEIQGFGLLDPALARSLAAAAVTGPRTEVCVTVTSPEGYAIGHGCARRDRAPAARVQAARGQGNRASGSSAAGLPARLNLTVPATALAHLAGSTSPVASTSSVGLSPWTFSKRSGTDPPSGSDPPSQPDGYGVWALVLPDGRRFTVRLDVVPTLACDHRYETPGYHPSARLRHLVQVRDGTCTFPSCNRHARESDFEHGVPYGQGGKTCACNAGARSRACHRVKQTRGWNVTQPSPGWHQWETPSGRIYVQEPKRYLT